MPPDRHRIVAGRASPGLQRCPYSGGMPLPLHSRSAHTRSVGSRAAGSRARLAGIGVFAALTFALAGCAGGGSNGSSSTGYPSLESAPMSGAAPAEVDGIAADASGKAASKKAIIQTGDLAIEVADPQQAADEVTQAIEPFDGSIEWSSVSAATEWEPASSSMSVRVPTDRFEDAITAISEVGKVVSVSRSTSDVTLQQADLSARVAALETSTERLRALMAEASNTADLIAAEGALTARQAELDGLTSQLASLDQQVDRATITVSLSAPGTAPDATPSNFWEAILLGVQSLGAAALGLGIALGVALPWIVVAAIIAGIVVVIVRASRRKSDPEPPETTSSGRP